MITVGSVAVVLIDEFAAISLKDVARWRLVSGVFACVCE